MLSSVVVWEGECCVGKGIFCWERNVMLGCDVMREGNVGLWREEGMFRWVVT